MHVYVGASADEKHVARGIVPGGDEELMVGVHDDGRGDGGDVREDEDAGDGVEAEVGGVDGAGVWAQVQGDPAGDHAGGNQGLLGDLVAGDGCVHSEERPDPNDATTAVHGVVVGHQEGVFFSLRDGSFPLFCRDVSLQTV